MAVAVHFTLLAQKEVEQCGNQISILTVTK